MKRTEVLANLEIDNASGANIKVSQIAHAGRDQRSATAIRDGYIDRAYARNSARNQSVWANYIKGVSAHPAPEHDITNDGPGIHECNRASRLPQIEGDRGCVCARGNRRNHPVVFNVAQIACEIADRKGVEAAYTIIG